MSLLSSQPSSQPQAVPGSSKRPSSPDHRRREDSRAPDYGPPAKRQRGSPPPRDRDRERWDGPPRRRHGSPPHWGERERDRDGPSSRRFKQEDREDEKPVVLPPVLSWFVGMLPAPAAFDGMFSSAVAMVAGANYGGGTSPGPIFRTDDLMQVFRNAVIPSSTSAVRPRSPPPAPPRVGKHNIVSVLLGCR